MTISTVLVKMAKLCPGQLISFARFVASLLNSAALVLLSLVSATAGVAIFAYRVFRGTTIGDVLCHISDQSTSFLLLPWTQDWKMLGPRWAWMAIVATFVLLVILIDKASNGVRRTVCWLCVICLIAWTIVFSTPRSHSTVDEMLSTVNSLEPGIQYRECIRIVPPKMYFKFKAMQPIDENEKILMTKYWWQGFVTNGFGSPAQKVMLLAETFSRNGIGGTLFGFRNGWFAILYFTDDGIYCGGQIARLMIPPGKELSGDDFSRWKPMWATPHRGKGPARRGGALFTEMSYTCPHESGFRPRSPVRRRRPCNARPRQHGRRRPARRPGNLPLRIHWRPPLRDELHGVRHHGGRRHLAPPILHQALRPRHRSLLLRLPLVLPRHRPLALPRSDRYHGALFNCITRSILALNYGL